MSSLFGSRGVSDPWFRLGRLEVGTIMLAVLVTVASWLAWVVDTSLPAVLAFTPEAVFAGQVWRLVTWPLANGLSLWGVLYLFFFWYFGTELEAQIGRRAMAWLLVGIWGSLTLTSLLIGGLLGGGLVLAGIGMIQFTLLLIWIAEYPRRPFFFGIPGWVIGAILLGLQILTFVAMRAFGSLVALPAALLLIAVVARRVGLLADYAWIPGGRRPGAPTQRRPKPAPKPRQQVRHERRRASDAERLDELLDKINEEGIHALSEAERRELMKLRERLRGS